MICTLSLLAWLVTALLVVIVVVTSHRINRNIQLKITISITSNNDSISCSIIQLWSIILSRLAPIDVNSLVKYFNFFFDATSTLSNKKLELEFLGKKTNMGDFFFFPSLSFQMRIISYTNWCRRKYITNGKQTLKRAKRLVICLTIKSILCGIYHVMQTVTR